MHNKLLNIIRSAKSAPSMGLPTLRFGSTLAKRYVSKSSKEIPNGIIR